MRALCLLLSALLVAAKHHDHHSKHDDNHDEHHKAKEHHDHDDDHHHKQKPMDLTAQAGWPAKGAFFERARAACFIEFVGLCAPPGDAVMLNGDSWSASAPEGRSSRFVSSESTSTTASGSLPSESVAESSPYFSGSAIGPEGIPDAADWSSFPPPLEAVAATAASEHGGSADLPFDSLDSASVELLLRDRNFEVLRAAHAVPESLGSLVSSSFEALQGAVVAGLGEVGSSSATAATQESSATAATQESSGKPEEGTSALSVPAISRFIGGGSGGGARPCQYALRYDEERHGSADLQARFHQLRLSATAADMCLLAHESLLSKRCVDQMDAALAAAEAQRAIDEDADDDTDPEVQSCRNRGMAALHFYALFAGYFFVVCTKASWSRRLTLLDVEKWWTAVHRNPDIRAAVERKAGKKVPQPRRLVSPLGCYLFGWVAKVALLLCFALVPLVHAAFVLAGARSHHKFDWEDFVDDLDEFGDVELDHLVRNPLFLLFVAGLVYYACKALKRRRKLEKKLHKIWTTVHTDEVLRAAIESELGETLPPPPAKSTSCSSCGRVMYAILQLVAGGVIGVLLVVRLIPFLADVELQRRAAKDDPPGAQSDLLIYYIFCPTILGLWWGIMFAALVGLYQESQQQSAQRAAGSGGGGSSSTTTASSDDEGGEVEDPQEPLLPALESGDSLEAPLVTTGTAQEKEQSGGGGSGGGSGGVDSGNTAAPSTPARSAGKSSSAVVVGTPVNPPPYVPPPVSSAMP